MNPVKVTKFETKSHGTPDEVRQPDKTKVEIGRLKGYTLGRFNLKPGNEEFVGIEVMSAEEYAKP